MDAKDLKLFSGIDNWTFGDNEELKITKVSVADGPNGLRKCMELIGNSDRTTCFPSPSSLACSFNLELEKQIGVAIGEECSFHHVDMLLAPAINIIRSPLGGRSFEYFSEDPLLTSALASSFVKGVQSTSTGAVIKHFCGNSQENARMINDAIIDKRALNEIYLKAFKDVITFANPYGLMTSYNKVNGKYVAEDFELMDKKLRKEWKYEGITMSDWGGVDNRVESLKTGLDLEMPYSHDFFYGDLCKALENNELNDVKSIPRLQNLSKKIKHNYIDKIDQSKHNDLVKVAILESSVLLKNDNNLLPLKKEEKVLVVGELFVHPRIQGGGSCHVSPTNVATPKIAFDKLKLNYDYLPGYTLKSEYIDKQLLKQVTKVAGNYDKIVVFVGLHQNQESEGYDRENLNLPKNQIHLIDELTYYYDNIIVVINDGSVSQLPFADEVGAILKVQLLGQTGAYAVPELLYGIVSPSGRLAQTYPLKLSDTPSYYDFGRNPRQSLYIESIYVGYRYYQKANKDVLYPFGHGLSYSEFKYSDLKVHKTDKVIDIEVTLQNIGNYDASEVVQVYSSLLSSNVYRPLKELKGFTKVFLKKGETKTIRLAIPLDEFKIFDVDSDQFVLEQGTYDISVAKSAIEDILTANIELAGQVLKNKESEIPSYYNLALFDALEFAKVYGQDIPVVENPKKYTFSSSMKEISSSLVARGLIKFIKDKYLDSQKDPQVRAMFANSFDNMPLRALVMLSNGKFSKARAEELLKVANGDTFDGLIGFISKK